MASFIGSSSGTNTTPYKADPLATVCLGVAKFISGFVIRHPFVVMRHQCQVHDHANQRHFLPFTVIPVTVKLATRDGILSLWKGAVGSGVLWAFSRVSELVIAELFGLPKTFVPDGSSERFWRHLLLKCSSFAACTPVIVSSFIETVRSGAGLTDDLQILEVIIRGFERLRQDIFGGSGVEGRRRHSLLWLTPPTAIYHTAHFLLSTYFYAIAFAWARSHVSQKLPSERKRYHTIMPELFSSMTSVFLTDLALYPLETILHRLYIQGTRTLVDNLDSGTGAVAFVPAGRYTGFFDCLTSIVRSEGITALFNGVGAVFLHYMLQHCFATLLYWLLDKGGRDYTSGPMVIKKTSGKFSRFESDSSNSFNSAFAGMQSQAGTSDVALATTGQHSHTTLSTLAQSHLTKRRIDQADGDNPFTAGFMPRGVDGAQFEFEPQLNNASTNNCSFDNAQGFMVATGKPY